MLLLVHAGASVYMAGLIWFVQVVHYPLMKHVGDADYQAYHHLHMRLTTWVVGPPMLAELICAVWIVANPPHGLPLWMGWAGLALLALVWASTFFWQVPRHRELERGFDARAHRRLVRSNGVRAVGWSLRGVIALSMIAAVG